MWSVNGLLCRGGPNWSHPCHYRKTSGELTRVSLAERVMKANYRAGTDHCDNPILRFLEAPSPTTQSSTNLHVVVVITYEKYLTFEFDRVCTGKHSLCVWHDANIFLFRSINFSEIHKNYINTIKIHQKCHADTNALSICKGYLVSVCFRVCLQDNNVLKTEKNVFAEMPTLSKQSPFTRVRKND